MPETAKGASPAQYNILRSPVVTEKASLLGSTVVFKVDPSSTKGQIKSAVERIFGVRVRAVRTCRYMGKIKRMGRSSGRRDSSKKAYVILEAGETLNVVEGI